jgi:flagellar motility protein MotE (MotC chaperone)
MRENLLKAAEKRIEERIGELKQLEASVGTAQQRQDDADQAKMKNLVTMYEAMKPKDAARIFDKLDMTILVDVAHAMKPAKLADVLAAMDADAAQRLTVALANRANPKPMATPEQPALDLPKIEGKTPAG